MVVRTQLVAFLAVLGTCIASGSLECGRRVQTHAQARGAELYGRMCAVCHGANGEGYKADQAPTLRHPEFLATVTDEFLRAAITRGRSGTTMSAWGTERGGPLPRGDVDAVIAFMRTWQTRPQLQQDERTTTGNAQRGAATFAAECAKCHGAHGTGGPHVGIGNVELLTLASNGFLRHAIRYGRAGTPMAGFGAPLGDAAVEDEIALLRTWQAGSPTTPPLAPAKPPPIPLGPVPLNPKGPEPVGFRMHPQTTGADIVHHELERGAKMALLDARAPSDYLNDHIKGAVSVPFYDPDPYFAGLPRDAWLVCYCACPHAESSTLAAKLIAKGFKKVTVLDEGLGVWRTKKYGTKTGIDP